MFDSHINSGFRLYKHDRIVPKVEKIKVEIGKLVKITSGGRHGWFESNVGWIRKPL